MKTITGLAAVLGMAAFPAMAEMLDVEKDELTLGFIKLTDMAPLAVAYENGYFEDEGLFVTLAHMLAGQPIAATIGYGTKAHIITPFSMDLNGNAITVSNDIWAEMKPNVPKDAEGKPLLARRWWH